MRVDRAGFQVEMAEHSKKSRGTDAAAAVFTAGPLDTSKQSFHQGSEFLGYATTRSESRVIGIVAQNQLTDMATVGTEGAPLIALVLDRTPFYGESGGQVGDTGVIRGEGFAFEVSDTKKDNDFTLHLGRVTEGEIALNATVVAEVNEERRQAIRRAHSATHILHHALHTHLGKHAQQAGSKVESDRLRFDFSNPEPTGRERLAAIEEMVNQKVLQGDAISWTTMPIAEAKSLGAMALFGEKYPDVVRVVQMGEYSRELCGGTHLDNAGQVGVFKVLAEEPVSAGTRRITALTGKAALDYIRQEQQTLAIVAAALKVAPSQARSGWRCCSKRTGAQEAGRAAEGRGGPEGGARRSAGRADGGRVGPGGRGGDGREQPDELRQLIDVLRRKSPTGLAVLLASTVDGKVNLAAGFTPDLIATGLHAGQWLKDVAPVVGGGGGGRPDLAQAGGKNPEKIPDALERAVSFLREQMT